MNMAKGAYLIGLEHSQESGHCPMAIDFTIHFFSKILWMGIVWWLWGYGAEINWNICFELSYPCNSLFSIWTCFWPLRFVNLNKLLKDKMFCVVYGKTRLHFHGDLICYVIIYIYMVNMVSCIYDKIQNYVYNKFNVSTCDKKDFHFSF